MHQAVKLRDESAVKTFPDWRNNTKHHYSGTTSRKYFMLTWCIERWNPASAFDLLQAYSSKTRKCKIYQCHMTSYFFVKMMELPCFTKMMVSYDSGEKYIVWEVPNVLCNHDERHGSICCVHWTHSAVIFRNSVLSKTLRKIPTYGDVFLYNYKEFT